MKKAEPKYRINELCRVFDISLRRYYYKPVTSSLEDINLMTLIKGISVDSGNTYGRRRIHVELAELGHGDCSQIEFEQSTVNVSLLLDQNNFKTKMRVNFLITSKSANAKNRMPNHVFDEDIRHKSLNNLEQNDLD